MASWRAFRFHKDRMLVQRMLRGDEAAFDAFFSTYFPRLYRFALLRLDRDPDEAEDAAQAALCLAMRKLATYRGEAALFTWLCTLCRHEIARRRERFRRRGESIRLTEDVEEVRAALESLAAAEAGQEAAVRRGELGRLVHVVLDQLPDHYAKALEWKYLEETTVGEIAQRPGLTPKAAESLLTRAREAFRDGFATLTAMSSAPERA